MEHELTDSDLMLDCNRMVQAGELRRLFDAYWDALPSDRSRLFADVEALDPLLADRLRGLISAETDSAPAEKAASGDLAAGREFGAFRVVERLGTGGMGQVFLAQQEKPVRRRVALKVMPWHASLDPEQRARFTAERQALASLSHPNVANFYAAGETEDGLAYFAMEHVPGQHIDRHCDALGLDHRQRIELVLQVCAGVSHAHRKGLIHRDLKPSNILVTADGAESLAKIIDFGIAKAATAGLRPETFETHAGRIVGTVNYMSPEQARGNVLVDTRADVYAIGVLLYRLLTGRTPFAFQTGELALSQIFRRLEQEDPKPPSELVSGPDAVFLRGDLDWICAKAVARNPRRRYTSVDALARDLEAFLERRAVEARPPTIAYRSAKFVSRHRAGVAAFGSVLLAALFTTLWSVHQARRVEVEAKTANEVITLLREAFSAADPSQGQSLTVLDVLGQAAGNLDGLAAENPVRARLSMELADVYMNLGQPVQALELWNAALEMQLEREGEQSDGSRRALVGKAIAHRELSQFDDSEDALRRVLELEEKLNGQNSSQALLARSNLAAHFLAQHRHDLALPLFKQAYVDSLEIHGPEHANTLKIAANLALSLRDADLGRAIDLAELALTGLTAVPGSDAIMLVGLEYNMLTMLGQANRIDEATARISDLYGRAEKLLGASHPLTQSIWESKGNLALASGDHDQAIEIMERALAQRVEALGPEHLQSIRLQSNLLSARFDRGDDPESLRPAVDELVTRTREFMEPDSRISIQSIGLAIEITLAAGRTADARALLDANELPEAERDRLLKLESWAGRKKVSAVSR